MAGLSLTTPRTPSSKQLAKVDMPALTLHLFALSPGADPRDFVRKIQQSGIKVVVASRPRHTVVRPTSLDANPLTSQQWDLLALLQSPDNAAPCLPTDLQQAVRNEYKVAAGIPSKLLASYAERDAKLKQEASSVPLTGSLDAARGKPSSQSLEISPELLAFMDELTGKHGYDGPVTMLNLLHFHPGGKQNYYQYGQVRWMVLVACRDSNSGAGIRSGRRKKRRECKTRRQCSQAGSRQCRLARKHRSVRVGLVE